MDPHEPPPSFIMQCDSEGPALSLVPRHGTAASRLGLKCQVPACCRRVGRKPAPPGTELRCAIHRRQLAKVVPSAASPTRRVA